MINPLYNNSNFTGLGLKQMNDENEFEKILELFENAYNAGVADPNIIAKEIYKQANANPQDWYEWEKEKLKKKVEEIWSNGRFN